jgi:hypothetical protein
MENIEEVLHTYGWMSVVFGFLLLIGLTALSLTIKHLNKKMKVFLFGAIVVTTVVPTLFLSGSTIYINAISISKGPVHWHADFQLWACGHEINLRDPKGLSNKIGTATLHEHSDNRIHLEGVVINPDDATLGKFFSVIEGSLKSSSMSVPVNEGMMMVASGVTCGDGIDRELQFFVYKTDADGYYHQEKLLDPATYSISPEGNIPPGDCVIAELDIPKMKTDKMCTSYQVAQKIGKLKGER